ncbi:hypothetical protein E1287_15870 [Actinomadura sp. KC06]|uniref:hypothetical protein n=1 Tax=Actinomadura sp. KC06 TaxID=2530369 RepID=UPI00104ECE25|nr:hypothetical protein [Actinomadura sp. KC06]TDD34670.1 hypothetical protein E1287_15870 [Actinomadura sp. KC06]
MATALMAATAYLTPGTASAEPPSPTQTLLDRMKKEQPKLSNAPNRPTMPARPKRSTFWSLGGQIVGPVSTVMRQPAGRSIFVRGTDNGVHHRFSTNDKWGPWENLGGQISSAVAVDSYFDSEKLDLAARGTDGYVWFKAHAAGGPWEKVGDLSIQGAPVIRHFANGDAIIFARGTDNAVWIIAQYERQWQVWGSLGGTVTSDIDVGWTSKVGSGVFARGTGNQLMHFPLFAPEPAWVSLGQTLASAPSVSVPHASPPSFANAENRIDVVARGTDNTVRYRPFVDTAWRPWMSIGGDTRGQPVVYPREIFYFEVAFLALGPSTNLLLRTYRPDNNQLSAWEDLGGKTTARPTPQIFLTGNPAGLSGEIYVRGTDGAVWATFA